MMQRKNLILFILIAVVAVSTYLIISSEAVKKTAEKVSDQVTIPLAVDLALLEKNYQLQTKVIVANFEKLVESGEIKTDQVEQIKRQLLDLKSPTKSDLTPDLVTAMNKMLEFLADKNESKKTESLSIIKQAKGKYAWLN